MLHAHFTHMIVRTMEIALYYSKLLFWFFMASSVKSSKAQKKEAFIFEFSIV